MKKKFIKISFIFLLFPLMCHVVFAQKTIRGHVQDAKNNEPLAATNIQIEGTFQGTISNQEGDFAIQVANIPSNLIISYIGYKSQRIKIDEESSDRLLIRMVPIILQMDPIVISAEDPAMAIMREVIRRKLEWRAKLNTYKAKAYNRLIFENDSGIVSIAESLSDTFWDHERGYRESIKSKRQTNNISETQNLAVASFIPNFYDDDIEIAGFKAIGPTHPEALDYYKFKLVKIRKLDDKTVFDIQVIPDNKLQPLFHGMISVLDNEFAVLAVDLVPSESIRFPFLIQELNLHYRQQFNNYKSDFWLPVDYRVEGDIKIGMTGLQFPKIIYKRITALTDYQINVSLPDSLYEEERILSVDSLSLQNDTLFTTTTISVPLTVEEDSAYSTLDSTMTLQKAFKPSGFLANLVEISTEENGDRGENGANILSYISPQLWYNRVDGLHAGLTGSLELFDGVQFNIGGGYKTGPKNWGYFSEVDAHFGSKKNWHSLLRYTDDTDSRYQSETWSMTLASLPPLLGLDDYFDYYKRKGIYFDIGHYFSDLQLDFTLGFFSEKHLSLKKTTDYAIFKTAGIQRDNPGINDGNMRSIIIRTRYGGTYIPFGVIGQSRALLIIETSQPGLIPSEYSFTRYTISVDWSMNTFLTRRLLPNTLNLHLVAGTSTGELPLQRFGIVDGSFQAVSPFATFRTIKDRPYEGEDYFAVYWEHNFGTVPFELINFSYAVDNGIGIILYGSHGRTWISAERLAKLSYKPAYTNNFHHELGISINNLFGLLRADTSYRLDNHLFYFGLSVARFF